MQTENNNYPTPITDANIIYDVKHSNRDGDCVYSDCVTVDVARELERQLTKTREQLNRLVTQTEFLLEQMDHPPERKCSCHITPPCSDCVEYSGLREAIEEVEFALAAVKGDSQ